MDAVADHLGIDLAKTSEDEELKRDVGAEPVMDEIESRENVEQNSDNQIRGCACCSFVCLPGPSGKTCYHPNIRSSLVLNFILFH
jgi:hypothetical protein